MNSFGPEINNQAMTKIVEKLYLYFVLQVCGDRLQPFYELHLSAMKIFINASFTGSFLGAIF